MQTKRTYKLSENDKAIILKRLAKGERTVDLAREYGVHSSNISHLRRNHNQNYQTVKTQLAEHQISIERRLLTKAHTLLERKLDQALEDEKDKTPIDKVSNVTMDIWKQAQVSEGNPTDITQSFKSISELRTFLLGSVHSLSESTPIELLNEPYNTSENK